MSKSGFWDAKLAQLQRPMHGSYVEDAPTPTAAQDDPQGHTLEELALTDDEMWLRWRESRHSGGEGVGLFNQGGQSWAEAAAQRAGRTAMGGFRNETHTVIPKAFIPEAVKDTRSAVQRFSTPGNSFQGWENDIMATTGLRGSQAVNPRDWTGMQSRLATETKRKREAAENIDLDELRALAHENGRAVGHDEGWREGWNFCLESLTNLYADEGLKGVQKLLDSLVDETADDAPEEQADVV